ncbi:MAG: tetratricopeptide repeat protein [Spirochaetales bacterium]|nr:tetratricopeptide repeat protein [Spirochaetales bacterium]
MTYFSGGKKKHKVHIYIIITAIVLLMIGGLVTWIYMSHKKGMQTENEAAELRDSLKKYFEQKNYLALIEKIDNELKNDPFSVEFLLYRGYSYFSLGEQENDLQKKRTLFSSSLIDLRRTIAVGAPKKNLPNIYYCLGKIYYYFGEPYYRLSLMYLNRSAELDAHKKDIHYMLGVVYANIGDYKKSAEAFKNSLKIEETDVLLMAIGTIYYKDGDYTNAAAYLQRVVKITNNARIHEKALFMMGQMSYDTKKYSDALKYFQQVLDINENNANAHFYIGEIYLVFGDKIKARSEWRRTLLIDPGHIRALKRIY